MLIDLSLSNTALYDGCTIEEVAGRKNLTTPTADAIEIVGRNIAAIVATIPTNERHTVTLTGPMAVWAYIICFHAVVHVFRHVNYADARGEYLVAAHG